MKCDWTIRTNVFVFYIAWFVSWAGSSRLLQAQTDSGAVSDAVAQMSSLSSTQISKMPEYKIMSSPHGMFGYDRVKAQPLNTGNNLVNHSTAIVLESDDQAGPPSDDGFAMSYQVPENQLYLEILPATNGSGRLLLHGATNEVYELMSKISLNDNAWHPEQALHRMTNEHQIYTVVSIPERTNMLFFWARDWTGVDENHDCIPDWWEWENFGDLNINVNQDYDGSGMSIREDYLAHIDPNKIRFYIGRDDRYVNRRRVKFTIDVLNGHPASMALLLDSTNFAAAVWGPVKTQLEVDLGSNEGWHEIRVGLRGRAMTSRQTWKCDRYYLDTTPPKLTITTPVNRVTV